MQLSYPITCEYFFVGFNNYIPKSKILLDYAYLFSSNDNQKNDNTTLK